jgi:hypothetical protein
MLAHDPAGQNRLQGLGGRYQYVRRASGLAHSLFGFSVAMSDGQLDVQIVAPPLEALKHVPVQSPQRSDVQDFDSRDALLSLKKFAQDRQERSLGFPSSRGRNQKNILSFKNQGDSLFLRLSRPRKPFMVDELSHRLHKQLKSICRTIVQYSLNLP